MCRACKLQQVQSASLSQQVGKIVQKVMRIDSKRSESVLKIKRVLNVDTAYINPVTVV